MSSLDDIVKKSADILGRIVKKTPLTPKLLSRPPFRYLHDLISEIILSSNFAQGLYSENEMNSENVKDKEAKIAYLTKIIDCVGISTKVEVKANPMKIVAGLEPEETNQLLQLLGKVVIKKVDSADAVQRVLAGEHQGKRRNSKGPSEPAKAAGKPGTTGSKADIRKGKSETKLEDTPAQPPEANPQSQRPATAQQKRIDPPTSEEQPPSTSSAVSRERDVAASDVVAQQRAESPETKAVVAEEQRSVAAPVSAGLPSTGQIAHDDAVPEEPVRVIDNDLEDRQARLAATARRMRPASARPAPPRQRAPEVALEEVPKDLPTIFTESKQEEDDESFVVIAHDNDDALLPTSEVGPLADEKHGGLVRTILQTKQDLEGKQEGDDGKGRANTGKDRGGKKEIEALRGWIQALTRSSNPLGKTMDYMQEDVDSMNRELEMWRAERKKYQALLDRELEITKEGIDPLEGQLRHIESAIEEQLERISNTKAAIIQNDTTIQTLLRGITKGGL